jgi:FkbH-like protein
MLQNVSDQRALPNEGARIRIFSSFTADFLRPSMEFWCKTLGLGCSVDIRAGGQVVQSLFEPEDNPLSTADVIVCTVRWEDMHRETYASSDELSREVLDIAAELASALCQSVERRRCSHVVVFCPESQAARKRFSALYRKCECLVSETVAGIVGLTVLAYADIARLYPVDDYYEAYGDREAKIPFTDACFASIGTMIVRSMHATMRRPRKVLVVDCDQTLWSGICAEDGPGGVVYDRASVEIQEFVREALKGGMVLALCSKNNLDDIQQVFSNNPQMALSFQLFASCRANWNPKWKNLIEIAEDLNLGLDSFVFIDDNPIECAEVKSRCPEILVAQLPMDRSRSGEFLRHLWPLDNFSRITQEDVTRSAFYKTDHARQAIARSSKTLDEFMENLQLNVVVESMQETDLSRVAQLSQRTNQFNCSLRRWTELELRTILKDPDCDSLVSRVSDRFGDYGLVGAAIAKRAEDAMCVDTFLLSCRALGRGVEDRLLEELAERSAQRGLRTMNVEYCPSGRNQAARLFLGRISHRLCDDLPHTIMLETAGVAETLHRGADKAGVAEETPLPRSARSERVIEVLDSEMWCRIATGLATAQDIATACSAGPCQEQELQEATAESVTQLERSLQIVWSRLLRADRVSIHANFLDLGGHSLAAMQLLTRIRDVFHVEIPFDDVFGTSFTISELARSIERHAAGVDPGAMTRLVEFY